MNQSYTPNPAVAAAGTQALGMASGAASQPFQLPVAPIAGFNPTQQTAFGAINNLQGRADPLYNQAAGYINQNAGPVSGAQVSAFYNPMAANVTAQLQNIFGKQASQTTGQLQQAAGGVGSDRVAVGQSDLANQQGLAAGQTYAGLYQQALQAAQQQQQTGMGAAYGLGNIAGAQQGTALQGIGAQLGAGAQQQQLSQAQLNAPYQNTLAKLAYPFQTAQYLAGITGGLGPALGGTTQGQTTYPAPSALSQILGGGIAGAGLLGQTGALSGLGSGLGSMFGKGAGAAAGAGGDALAGAGGAAAAGGGSMLADFAPLLMLAKRGGRVIGKDDGGGVSGASQSVGPENWLNANPYIPKTQLQPGSGQHPLIYPQYPVMPGQSQGQNSGVNIGQIMQMMKSFQSAGGGVNPYAPMQGYADGGDVSSWVDTPQSYIDTHFPDQQPPSSWVDTPQSYIDTHYPKDRPNFNDRTGGMNFTPGWDPRGNALQDYGTTQQGANSNVLSDPPSVPLPRPRPADAPAPPMPPAMASAPPSMPPPVPNAEIGSGPPTAPNAAPATPFNLNNYKEPYPDATKIDTSGQWARSPWTPLIAAGLGIMGGTSPFAGVNIGRGGLQGLQALEKQRADLRSEEAVNLNAKKLAMEAENLQRKYTQMTPYEEAEIRNKALLQTPLGVYDRNTGRFTTWEQMMGNQQGQGAPNAPGAPPSATPQAPISPQLPLTPYRLGTADVPPPTNDDLARVMQMKQNPLAAQMMKSQYKGVVDQINKDVIPAQMVQGDLSKMERNYENLLKQDVIQPGAGVNATRDLFNTVDTISRYIGTGQWNENSTGSIDALNKLSNQLGFSLARTLGAREAMQIVQQSIQSVPNATQNPQSFRRVLAEMNARAQEQIDRHSTLEQWQAKHYGDVTGFTDWFQRTHPHEAYTKMADDAASAPRVYYFDDRTKMDQQKEALKQQLAQSGGSGWVRVQGRDGQFSWVHVGQ